jgi:hypothetical protein
VLGLENMSSSLEHEHRGEVYKLRHKFGEVSGKPLYQVVGEDCWMSSPDEAVDVHLRMRKAINSGYYNGKPNKP